MTHRVETTEVINPPVLRPRQAAPYAGMSLGTFWRKVRDDDTFPVVFKIGPQSSAIMRADMDEWLEAQREKALRRAGR